LVTRLYCEGFFSLRYPAVLRPAYSFQIEMDTTERPTDYPNQQPLSGPATKELDNIEGQIRDEDFENTLTARPLESPLATLDVWNKADLEKLIPCLLKELHYSKVCEYTTLNHI
jgi:hypothetical protein